MSAVAVVVIGVLGLIADAVVVEGDVIRSAAAAEIRVIFEGLADLRLIADRRMGARQAAVLQ